jgi:nucleoid-associated protein YgaU
VIDSAMATDVDDQIQATGIVANAFPPGVREIHIVLVLDGVGPGDEITGRWFQLVDDGPPGGTELSSAGIVLTEDNVISGAARVALHLSVGPEGFPIDDYLVRVYAGEEFIKTSAFVVSRFVVHPASGSGADQPTQGAQAEPTATPAPPAPSPTSEPQQAQPTPTPAQQAPEPTATTAPPAQPETYTVVSGDTLTIIAERFKTPQETTESYVTRLEQANNLAPGSILVVGQVLTLPGPP